ncbi:MAG TPA: endopeptidase La [Candidatus Brocadiia bacterium]|nr:endopeptidase La [Candidatus Brocadiia bacterium]
MASKNEDIPIPPGGKSLDDVSQARDESRLPQTLPVLAVRDTVVYPIMITTLRISEPEDLKLVDDIMSSNKLCVLMTTRAEPSIPVKPDELYSVGTTCAVLGRSSTDNEEIEIQVQGVMRSKAVEFVSSRPYLVARIQHVRDAERDDLETHALMRGVADQFLRMIDLIPEMRDEMKTITINMEEPGRLADYVASNLSLPIEEKQELLEAFDPAERLRLLVHIITREVDIMTLARKIQDEARNQISRGQRNFYLRQQIKAIEEDLGAEDPQIEEAEEIRKQLDELDLPEEARKEADRELGRIIHMPPASAEFTVARTYLDWVTALPWNTATVDNLDLTQARAILDEDHFDLEKAKDRIIEFLAVRKLRNDLKGGILCFIGPPGTGKTSMGKSIARAMGRKYVRVSLGGIRDEAEIRGHRRTYIGALPGRIISGLRKAQSRNPVFVLDEVDKLGQDFRGDPASALLEVLDPEQNASFTDHYLDVPFDISRVMFICTANYLDGIPHVLRDRMEMLELSGYTHEDKLQIARSYLIPKQVIANGLADGQLSISDDAVGMMIRSYTREAGLRNLEREIASVCRKTARAIAAGEAQSFSVTPDTVVSLLGPEKFQPELAERVSEPGVAIGMAWTPTGGEILFIEATLTPGKGRLLLTGKLGNVMKESARAALSRIRTSLTGLTIKPADFARRDIHIHVPSGAISKDGPSAGVALATALASLLTGKRVRPDVAMTGEITLRGVVMPVGGVKEKVLAARRAGIRMIIIPKSNEKNISDLPEYARKDLDFHCVSRLEEVFPLVFGPGEIQLREKRPTPARTAKPRRSRKSARARSAKSAP